MSATRQLLEREDEIATLERSMEEARAGTGRLVLVRADAGGGKSSLVAGFAAEHFHDSRIAWGVCDSLWATPRTAGPVHEIAGLFPATRDLIQGTGEIPACVFRALLEDLTRSTRPSIVILEDFHWADATTRDFFRFLSRRVQRTNALFIVTYRSDELSLTHPARLALGEQTGDHVVRLQLEPLSLSAVEKLATASGRDPGPLHGITGGNPFFVKESIASPDEWLPQTVRDAVVARFMRCSVPARELIEFVSMSLTKTEAWLLEDLLGLDQAAVDEAVDRGLIERHGDALGFRHELARRAVHSTLATERGRNMHQRLLDALTSRGADVGRLLHHAIHANSASTLRAELFERHARQCSLSNRATEAVASATTALDLWRESGNVESQARLLCFLSQEYWTLGDKARADECVGSAMAMLEALPLPLAPAANLAIAYNARALLAAQRGRNAEALEFGRRALALALTDPGVEAHALANIGSALVGAGDLSGFEQLERSLALALEHNLEDLAGRVYAGLMSYAILARDFDRVERVFAEGTAYCDEHGLAVHGAHMQGHYTFFELARGNWTNAAHKAEKLLHSGALVGMQRVPALLTLALVRIRLGETGVDELLGEASALALPAGELNFIGKIAAARAELAWYQGRMSWIAREAIAGLSQLQGHTAPWIKGELLVWRRRSQPLDSLMEGVSSVAEPYRLMLAGDWRAAAGFWERAGMRYEQALALSDGPEEALREALAIAESLEMRPLAEISRKRLRVLGARGVPRGPSETTRNNPAGLTAKEIEVLRLLVQGCTNAQLARQLHRSTKTVDHHVSAILDKLGVRSRSEAIVAAFELGIATELRLVGVRSVGAMARLLRPPEAAPLLRQA